MRKRWKAARIISIALIAILVISHTAMSFASTGALETGDQPAAAGQKTSEVNKIQEKSETGVPEETMMPPSSSESNMSEEESDYLQAIDNASSESENKVESTSDNEDRIPADNVNSKATSGEKAQELTLDKEKLSIQVGNTGSLKATVEPQDASLKWKSDNKKVAEVSSDGTVTGVGIGTATITVSSGKLSAKAIVTVSRNTSNDVVQDAYFYIRKPGASEGSSLFDTWYYAGMGEVNAPIGTGKGEIYDDLSMITKYPNSYPEIITADGQKYVYDADAKENPKPNTYYIEWEYIKDETGANNGYEQLTHGQAYHVDGRAVLNDDDESGDSEQDAYFYIWKPGADENASFVDTWYYAGMGKVKAPTGTGEGQTYEDLSMITKYPESYPVIKVDEQDYTYDASENPAPNTYSINWKYIKDETGANEGHSTITQGQAYHVDGYAVLNFEISATGYKGVYDGEAHEATVRAPSAAKVEYFADGQWTTSAPTITNVGEKTYNVRATLDGITKETQFTLKVIPAELTVTAKDQSKAYGEEIPKLTGEITGFVKDDTVAVLTGGNASYTTAATKDTPVGEYDIIAEGDLEAANYTFKYEKGTLTITPVTKETVVTITGNQKTTTYNGNSQSVTEFEYETADGIDKADFNVELKGENTAIAEGTNAGIYNMGLTQDAFTVTSDNYKNIKVVVNDGYIKIEPAPLQIIANNANKVQGTENPKFSAQIAGLLGDDGKGALEGEMMFECSADKDSPIGEYIIMPYGLTADNYDIEYITGLLSVTLIPEPPAPPTAPTITVPVDTPPTTPTGTVGGTDGGTAPTADGNNTNAVVTAAAGTAAPLVTIDEGEVPMAAGNGNAHWALLNLILTVLTALMSIVLIALYFTKRREREDEGKIVEQQQEERGLKKKGVPRILSAVWAVLMIVVFFLTEDMDLPMQLTDKWTIIMAIMTIVQIVIAFFAKKKYRDNEKDNDLAQA